MMFTLQRGIERPSRLWEIGAEAERLDRHQEGGVVRDRVRLRLTREIAHERIGSRDLRRLPLSLGGCTRVVGLNPSRFSCLLGIFGFDTSSLSGLFSRFGLTPPRLSRLPR